MILIHHLRSNFLRVIGFLVCSSYKYGAGGIKGVQWYALFGEVKILAVRGDLFFVFGGEGMFLWDVCIGYGLGKGFVNRGKLKSFIVKKIKSSPNYLRRFGTKRVWLNIHAPKKASLKRAGINKEAKIIYFILLRFKKMVTTIPNGYKIFRKICRKTGTLLFINKTRRELNIHNF